MPATAKHTASRLQPPPGQQIDEAVWAAREAAALWGSSSDTSRAAQLQGLATALEGDRKKRVVLADLETALGPMRLNIELDRTTFHLLRFADIAKRGDPFGVLDDPSVAEGESGGHLNMQRVRVPLGRSTCALLATARSLIRTGR